MLSRNSKIDGILSKELELNKADFNGSIFIEIHFFLFSMLSNEFAEVGKRIQLKGSIHILAVWKCTC